MINFREVNDSDILSEWIAFREEDLSSMSEQDQKHYIKFEEIAKEILKNVPEQNKNYVQKQLDKLDDNFMDYIFYWNEKYYRNGFCDGVEIILSCINN